MGFDQDLFRSSSVSLRNHDYCTAGLHFVTLCTYQRRCWFGDIVDGCMQLNAAGDIVASSWCDIAAHHCGVSAGAFVVMPNHVHGIVLLRPSADAEAGGMQRAATLGEAVRAFRTRCQLALSAAGCIAGHQLWQHKLHTHALGDQRAYEDAIRYIENDPQRWPRDIYYEDPWMASYRALFRSAQADRSLRRVV